MRIGLAVLSEVATRCDDSFTLFSRHWDRIWSDSNLPLRLVIGFSRCIRAAGSASNHVELVRLAMPLRDDALRQLQAWDPQYVSGKGRLLTERRFSALAGLMPLGPSFDDPLLQELQAKLSGASPETMLACATPVLAAMAKQCDAGPSSPKALAEKVCVAVASLPASLDLQDYALDLCEALLTATPTPAVSHALAALAAAPCESDTRRCYELLGRSLVTEETLQHLLQFGLVHEDAFIQRISAEALARLPSPSEAVRAKVIGRVVEVALGADWLLLEKLADVFTACQTTFATSHAAKDMLTRIEDPTKKVLVAKSFEALCAEKGEKNVQFHAFMAEMRALSL
eukprot:TRINITY_DN23566_c0_g1_i2.p1 TRINITY_DN23566_c0_g1~~TRINITY_DN23566_c0_g1_i2.p1  ORF type:complete len:342 (-),score=63.43 TRINITY_DN23566_c0_g1_i2:271-1296(-)